MAQENQANFRVTFEQYDKLEKLNALKTSRFQRNKHPKEQIERLAKIMRETGIRHPIHVHKEYGEIAFGHGRKEAAKFNGWKEYPIVYQTFKDDDEYYTCVQSDNAIAGWAELDLASINADLPNLGPDFDIDLLGIKDFVLEPAEKFEAQCDEDEVPEVKESFVKPGDLWQLGNHRLLCGDSTNIQHVELLMGGEKADMVLTDPPYGIGFEYNAHKDIKGIDYLDFCSEWFANLTTLTDFIVIFTGWSYNGFWYSKEPKDTFYWLCRNKRSGGSISNFRKVEPIFIWGKPATKYDFDFFDITTKIDPDLHKVHTCPKQVDLIEAVLSGCKERGAVVDIFGGSGTTLIACEKTNRKCSMMELDPHYCGIIIERWQKYTGKKAERINGQA